MKIPKDHLKTIQVELFFKQMNDLNAEEKELNEHFNIARNLACSEWEYGIIPSPAGGHQGLKPARMLPEKMDLLRKNYTHQQMEISYRRYALMKAYYPIIKDRIGGSMGECFEYWEKQKELV